MDAVHTTFRFKQDELEGLTLSVLLAVIVDALDGWGLLPSFLPSELPGASEHVHLLHTHPRLAEHNASDDVAMSATDGGSARIRPVYHVFM